MAFLCPTGFPAHRRRKRVEMTAVNSSENDEKSPQTETEFEPTKMVVVRNFSPCVDDELEVQRGQHVKALYQENEWRYVVAEDGKEGFIPYTYCIPVTQQMTKTVLKNGLHNRVNFSSSLEVSDKLRNSVTNTNSVTDTSPFFTKSSILQSSNCEAVEQEEFVKRQHGQYVVLYDYNADQEDDISINQGEKVSVLNKDDRDWYWVKTQDAREGFVPRQYLQHAETTVSTGANNSNHSPTTSDSSLSMPTFLRDGHNIKSGVKQLRAICDFISQRNYELSVKRGEQLFTDDNNIDKFSWIWVYSPLSKKCGFVPSGYVHWAQNSTFL